MNNKRFLSTITAVFSCVLIGISSITANAAGTYNFDDDVWKFRNHSRSFSKTYVFTENDNAALRKNLSNIDLRLANDLIGDSFLGSCYGMAATSILASYGLIDYGAYTENADSLYTMSGVEKIDGKPSDDILSLINFYTALQFTEEIRQYVAYSALEQTDADRLDQIIENAEQGIPSLVGYFGETTYTGDRYGHAVVAYDVEYGPFEVEYFVDNGLLPQYETAEFDGRIAVYNCNNFTHNNSYIYFNNDHTWRTDKVSSDDGGNISTVVSDIDLLNNKGLLSGTNNYSNSRDFLSLLTLKSTQQDRTLQRISFDGNSWSPVDTVEGQINEFPVFLGDFSQMFPTMYVLKDSESGYVLSTDGMGTMSAQMNYQNSLLMADVNEGDQIVFDPSGYIEVNGDNTSFSLEMTFNEGYYTGDWYNITVKGTADDASLLQTDEGYILRSDTLTEFTVTVNDGDLIRGRCYDLTDLDSVLIFEQDDRSVGLAADMDNNGSYETVLQEIANGDVNNDNVLTIADIVLLQEWLLAVPDAHLVNWKAADMNYDNKLDVFDLCLMKKALLSVPSTV